MIVSFDFNRQVKFVYENIQFVRESETRGYLEWHPNTKTTCHRRKMKIYPRTIWRLVETFLLSHIMLFTHFVIFIFIIVFK